MESPSCLPDGVSSTLPIAVKVPPPAHRLRKAHPSQQLITRPLLFPPPLLSCSYFLRSSKYLT